MGNTNYYNEVIAVKNKTQNKQTIASNTKIESLQ